MIIKNHRKLSLSIKKIRRNKWYFTPKMVLNKKCLCLQSVGTVLCPKHNTVCTKLQTHFVFWTILIKLFPSICFLSQTPLQTYTCHKSFDNLTFYNASIRHKTLRMTNNDVSKTCCLLKEVYYHTGSVITKKFVAFLNEFVRQTWTWRLNLETAQHPINIQCF